MLSMVAHCDALQRHRACQVHDPESLRRAVSGLDFWICWDGTIFFAESEVTKDVGMDRS